MYLKISKSKVDGKKLTAIFYDDNRTKIKTVHFGADGYIDYTISPHDKEKRKQYINRHRTNENWNDPMSAGTLSRYILWEHPLLSTAINNYIKMFRLKKY
jgi:hypothetical protein